MKEGKKYEAMSANRRHLQTLATGSSIETNAIATRKDCGNCGRQHPRNKCPAYHDICKSCGTKGHWAKVCRKSRNRERQPQQQQPQGNQYKQQRGRRWRSSSRRRFRRSDSRGRSADEIQANNNDDNNNEDASETLSFYNITVSNMCLDEIREDDNELYANLDIVCPEKQGQHHLRVKVDTGSGGNTLPIRTICQMYPNNKWKKLIKKTKDTLTAYNGQGLKVLGTIDMVCKYNQSTWVTEKFYVVDVPGPAVAGLPTCRKLKLVTINAVEQQNPDETSMQTDEVSTHPNVVINSVESLMTLYPEQFDTIGNFKGEAKLHLKDDAIPNIDPPRKCSIHLKDKLKAELDSMERQQVIEKVTYHTDWCSSITTTVKKNGDIRVCLDPKRHNQSLKRCPHKIPTVEELNPEFANAKYFSKLDAKAGYWSVHLAAESRDLTTFRTPFGRYRFLRLPFGISVSQDIFQQYMDSIISQVPGCVGIADDIAVFGETEREHDENLIKLLQIAKQEGLVFNSEKCWIKVQRIAFFGSV